MDDEGLVVDLSSLSVEDYCDLVCSINDSDLLGVAVVLDKYTAGGLLNRHWINLTLAIEQAQQQIAATESAFNAARAAAGWANMVSKPTWAARQ